VQHSLDRMFQRFDQVPSVRQLCQWYLDHEEPLPYVAHGDDPHHVQITKGGHVLSDGKKIVISDADEVLLLTGVEWYDHR